MRRDRSFQLTQDLGNVVANFIRLTLPEMILKSYEDIERNLALLPWVIFFSC